jgi:hypothetical protein
MLLRKGGKGDAAPSTVGSRLKNLSAARIGRASLVGAGFNGLILPSYYSAVQARMPNRDPKSIVLKVCLDGILWGFAGNAALMALRLRMEGLEWSEAIAHAKREIPAVFRSDLCVWTTYNSLCYGSIPKNLQPMSTAIMSSAWSAYISWVSVGKNANQKAKTH